MRPVSTATSDNTNNWLSPLGQLPPAFPNGYVEEIDLPSPESRSMQIFQTGLIITNDVDTLARLLKNITRDVMNKFTYRVNLYACDSDSPIIISKVSSPGLFICPIFHLKKRKNLC